MGAGGKSGLGQMKIVFLLFIVAACAASGSGWQQSVLQGGQRKGRKILSCDIKEQE